MTPTWRRWAVNFGFIALVCGIVWFLDWNEFHSPWGRDVQAAKLEILKAKLCN